ncbi:MAG: TRAP transporter substrate-binding protein DctP [Synergistes sp.]|nr:TRAP transporter substrate-binding protein DctP [Synergistes sp.]
MKKLALLFAAFVISAALSVPAHAAPLTFKFAGQSPPDHQATVTMKAMAKEIEKGTNGRVVLKVYPAGQLGNYSLIMEEMARGTVDMACMSVATDLDPQLEMTYANGFATSYAAAKKALNPDAWFTKKIDSILNKLGVKLIGSYVEGFIGIASVKELKEPLNPKVDKGVLTRVPNMASYLLGAKAMGFRPITIPYPDVYQSLQTGVCDAADGYPTAAAYTILGDVIKYWYATNYSIEYLGFMVSDKSWKKLSKEDQKVFISVAKKYTNKSIENAEKEDNKYMELMKKKGIKVFKYSEKELKPLRDACVGTWEPLGKSGTGVELMKEFKKNLGNL